MTMPVKAVEEEREEVSGVVGRLQDKLVDLRVVGVAESEVRGHLLDQETGHTVYHRMEVAGRVEVGWW